MTCNLLWTQVVNGIPLYCLRSASNTYAIVEGNTAILFDYSMAVTVEALKEKGIEKIHAIYLTSHDRTSCSGVYNNAEIPVFIPDGASNLIEEAESIWSKDDKVRYHMVDFNPDKTVPCSNIKTSGSVKDGDTIQWNDWKIQVVSTPGFYEYAVSYLLTFHNKVFCVCGKLLYEGGRISELYLLQQGFNEEVCGYHGFFVGLPALHKSLNKVKIADMLLPVCGNVEENPSSAIEHFIINSNNFMTYYSKASALNYYFPDYLKIQNPYIEPAFRAKTVPLPEFIKYIPDTTSFVIFSRDKSAFVADCSMIKVIEYLGKMKTEGKLKTVDFCWVSHYHHDHVEKLSQLMAEYSCPVYADSSFSDILRNPDAYYLTCLSELAADVTPISHNTKIKWHEFNLTFYHFPGQTLYHGGLLLEGYGLKIFFSGDSFSPTGFDDYCTWNRNFLKEESGYFKCINLLEQINPDLILNQHQGEGLVYTDSHYSYLRKNLYKRKEILQQLVYGNIDEASDPLAVRCKPYGIKTFPGAKINVKVYFTGHENKNYKAQVEPLLPEGWKVISTSGYADVCPSSGLDFDDASQNFIIELSEKAKGRYAIPFNITMDSRQRGLLCHMIVDVSHHYLP